MARAALAISRSPSQDLAKQSLLFKSGGGWSATLTDQITATVGFYPGSSWERHAPVWSHYSGKECLIHCAEGDGTSAAPGIQEALREINTAGGKAVAFDYAGTSHAFFNNDRPEVFSVDAAKLAWARTINFFAQQLSE